MNLYNADLAGHLRHNEALHTGRAHREAHKEAYGEGHRGSTRGWYTQEGDTKQRGTHRGPAAGHTWGHEYG